MDGIYQGATQKALPQKSADYNHLITIISIAFIAAVIYSNFFSMSLRTPKSIVSGTYVAEYTSSNGLKGLSYLSIKSRDDGKAPDVYLEFKSFPQENIVKSRTTVETLLSTDYSSKNFFKRIVLAPRSEQSGIYLTQISNNRVQYSRKLSFTSKALRNGMSLGRLDPSFPGMLQSFEFVRVDSKEGEKIINKYSNIDNRKNTVNLTELPLSNAKAATVISKNSHNTYRWEGTRYKSGIFPMMDQSEDSYSVEYVFEDAYNTLSFKCRSNEEPFQIVVAENRFASLGVGGSPLSPVIEGDLYTYDISGLSGIYILVRKPAITWTLPNVCLYDLTLSK